MSAARKLEPEGDLMLARLLAAPLDDAPETDEEREAVSRIQANVRADRPGRSTSEVLAALSRDE